VGIILYFVLLNILYWGGINDLTGFTTTSNLSVMDTSNETGTGGLFGVGISFSRWYMFMTFGVGLPADTPDWFQYLFSAWTICVDLFVLAWIISSIWNG